MPYMYVDTEYEVFLRQEKMKYFDVWDGIKILDVGGGDGALWRQVYPYKYDSFVIDCVDSDPIMRYRAEKSGIYRKVFDSVAAPGIDYDEYDAVTVLGVLEHCKDALQLMNFLRGMDRIYITVPNARSFHRFVGVALGMIDDVYALSDSDISVGHYRVYDIDLLYNDVLIEFSDDYEIDIWTTSFKILDSKSMMMFGGDKIKAFNEAFKEYEKQSGIMYDIGAEIVAYLRRK